MEKSVKKGFTRKKLLSHRLSFPKSKLDLFSKKICKRLEESKEFKKSKKILLYFPIKNEVNILPLIKKYIKTKSILLPKINENCLDIFEIETLTDLQKGTFNIPEPHKDCKKISFENIDLVIVPGIAFDINKHRIGFGKGFYDSILVKIKCPKIALAYDFQIIENIEGENHDQKVDIIMTEKNIF